MQTLGILSDPRFRKHHTGPGHPERPERLDAVERALAASGVSDTAVPLKPRLINEHQLTRVHSATYLQHLEGACRQAWPYVDSPDCPISPETWDIARLAAGGVVWAARQVADGAVRRAFCAVRPPGHHAEADRAAGFCFMNNVALAARVLQDAYDVDRILILDFDVHHGNGTQHAFEQDPGVLYISLHGHPAYLFPHTGFEEETGQGPGRGYTLNVALAPEADDDVFRQAFESRVVPEIERYAPQFFIVSAGYDGHTDDPLGNLRLSDDTFAWMDDALVRLADRLCGGKLISVLEGGYNLDVLERCVAAHVRRLADA